MSRSFRLSLQGWLLALLMPGLGLLILGYAISAYSRLHQYVIAGFDAKMTAASATTAAFIDPADHRHLVEPLPISSMTHDSNTSTIWALDTAQHELLKIHADDGRAESSGIKIPPEIDNISNDTQPDSLLLVDNQAGHFLHFSIATRKIEPAFDVRPPISALATAIRRNRLFIAGRDLRQVDLATRQISTLHSLPEPVRDLTYDRKRDVLWALTEAGDALLALDPGTGALQKKVKLAYRSAADADDASQVPKVHLRSIVFERIGFTLFGSFDSLLRIDPEKGTVSAQGYQAAFGQEQGPLYHRYAGAMSRIMARSDLTYLYTQVVQGHDHIVYGLDATVGKDHSPLLSTDTVRPAEIPGIQRLLTEGAIYVSPIEPWPPWGLLKSSFTPIFDARGVPVAMTGADINATVIEYQIRKALVITFGFGGVMLIGGGLLAYGLARRLTGPLEKIKTAALHAAAGDFNQTAVVSRPAELRALAERFTAASGALGRAIESFRSRLEARREERDRNGLIDSLGRQSALAEARPGAPWAWGFLGAGGGSASGATQARDRVLAWIARPSGDPLATAARRAEIAMTAEALLVRHGADPAALGAVLEGLFAAEVAAWALAGPDGLRVHLRESGWLRRIGAGGAAEAAAGWAEPLRPETGELVVLAGADAPFGAAPPAAESAPAWLERWRKAAPAAAFALVLASP